MLSRKLSRFGIATSIGLFLLAIIAVVNHIRTLGSDNEVMDKLRTEHWFVQRRGPSWMPRFVSSKSMAITEVGIDGELVATKVLSNEEQATALASLSQIESIHIYGGFLKAIRGEEIEKECNLPIDEMPSMIRNSLIGKVRSIKPNIQIRIHPRLTMPEPQ